MHCVQRHACWCNWRCERNATLSLSYAMLVVEVGWSIQNDIKQTINHCNRAKKICLKKNLILLPHKTTSMHKTHQLVLLSSLSNIVSLQLVIFHILIPLFLINDFFLIGIVSFRHASKAAIIIVGCRWVHAAGEVRNCTPHVTRVE